MTHIHWVARQNKLEIPNDEEEVNTREIHKCDGQAHDPDTMVAPLTPKPKRKIGAFTRSPPTIVLSHVVILRTIGSLPPARTLFKLLSFVKIPAP